ncbi:MAG TPA: hypothetical protein VMY37_05340 [Thermoguttaceae bacterium]|nr:hypothetical protein [Thermoguttaceae bacterium]
MGILFEACIAFDDDTPDGDPPFSHNPGIWIMREDYALSSCGEMGFFAALGYDPENRFTEPMVTLRGFPEFVAQASELRQWMGLEDYVGWLSAAELFSAISHAAILESDLVRSVRVFLGAVRYLSSEFGEERVRVIFTFLP